LRWARARQAALAEIGFGSTAAIYILPDHDVLALFTAGARKPCSIVPTSVIVIVVVNSVPAGTERSVEHRLALRVGADNPVSDAVVRDEEEA